MRAGIASAYAAIVAALKGINGAAGGYVHDIGGRVYDVLKDPEQIPMTELPYVCVQLFVDGGKYPPGQTCLATTLPVTVQAFGPATESVTPESGNSVMVAELHDDLLRALIPADGVRWNLGCAAIKTITPTGFELLPADVGDRFNLVQLSFDVELQLDNAALAAVED